MTRTKPILIKLMIIFFIALVSGQTARAACEVSCAAICRYTCAFTLTGNCSDEEAFNKVNTCCDSAYENTPGLTNCGRGGELD